MPLTDEQRARLTEALETYNWEMITNEPPPCDAQSQVARAALVALVEALCSESYAAGLAVGAPVLEAARAYREAQSAHDEAVRACAYGGCTHTDSSLRCMCRCCGERWRTYDALSEAEHKLNVAIDAHFAPKEAPDDQAAG